MPLRRKSAMRTHVGRTAVDAASAKGGESMDNHNQLVTNHHSMECRSTVHHYRTAAITVVELEVGKNRPKSLLLRRLAIPRQVQSPTSCRSANRMRGIETWPKQASLALRRRQKTFQRILQSAIQRVAIAVAASEAPQRALTQFAQRCDCFPALVFIGHGKESKRVLKVQHSVSSERLFFSTRYFRKCLSFVRYRAPLPLLS